MRLSRQRQDAGVPPVMRGSIAPLPRGEGGMGGRACLRLSQAQRECSHTRQDARSSGDTIARAHANQGRETKAHGHGPQHTTQGVEGIQQTAPAVPQSRS